MKNILLFGIILFTTSIYAQEPTYKWELINPKYPTADAFVAGLNAADYGADLTGTTDQTALLQKLLDFLGSRSNNDGRKSDGTPNGGTLFLPEGKYLICGYLYIPKGVTIRGEWEKPVKGQPIKGTIIVCNNPSAKGHDCTILPNGTLSTAYEAQSTITMQPSSAVRDLAFWYPEQDADNITPYPPAILFGQQGYWGNDYCLASNITLVNAYDGIIFSRRNGGGAPNCYGIYGTPLRRGIEIDNIAEVGRIDNVDFSPDYWAGSGLPDSPTLTGKHRDFILENGTAVVMRRNDWSFICKVNAEGYNIGYRLDLSYNDDTNGNKTAPNGHNYGMEFTDCKYGVYVAAVSGSGMMFYEYKFKNCDYGFWFDKAAGGVVQIQGCEFDANTAAIYAPSTNNTKILMNQNVIKKGAINIQGGLASLVKNDFESEDVPQVILGANARATLTGNYRANNSPVSVKNLSMYECINDETPLEISELPHFPYKNQYEFTQKPAGSAFYVANAETGVTTAADDNSDALQALLNQAKNEGGGLVFLPPGHYNFRKPLTIPAGVELKGSVDVPSLPTGPGSAMEIYAGKGDEDGTPFITMEPGSGFRGMVVNYPEQIVQLLTEAELNNLDVYHFPYTVRGNRDVYIVNIAFRTAYHGIDLFTNKCDNHFVDYPAGHVFKTGIRVGGGSEGGHIYNAQFNQIAYGSGGETKFGRWPNSPDNLQADQTKYSNEHDMAYAYCWNNLYFMTFENCKNEVLYNNFDFGSNRGFTLADGANGICLGQGIDQGMNSFYIDGIGEDGFDFINTQIVTTAPSPGVQQTFRDNNRYFQTTANFSGLVTFFGADFWGQPQRISNDILGGTLELQAGNYSNSGQQTFANIASGAEFNVTGSNINNISSLLTSGSAPQFFVQSSLVNKNSLDVSICGLWLNNLEFSASVSPNAGAFLPRTGWIATASTSNADAQNSLDGNADTRWSTLSERQKPGQWFQVDMLEPQTFTGVYLDPGTSNVYLPVSFKVLISDNGSDWTQIALGSNTAISTFSKQTARYIRIEQTGSGSNAWRITEFYVMNTEYTGSAKISEANLAVNFWIDNSRLYFSGLQGRSQVKIYNTAGVPVHSQAVDGDSVYLNIPRGIYIVTVENGGRIFRTKIVK
ncbi:MAG: discoidin domain-containing protein [Dysgonamonadaceae bacterium]|jgi:hypothetical protein|nr:discoidin domain-containing protein [Dysgonamonadaceae bacterium]